jgi:hypothetical protein
MINQLPLWCRECGATYEEFNDQGVCTNCETPNVLERHSIVVTIPVDAFSLEDARALVQKLVQKMVDAKLVSPETTVF